MADESSCFDRHHTASDTTPPTPAALAPAAPTTPHDVLAIPGPPTTGPSLATVLTPAVEPHSPVPATVVADLLTSISLHTLAPTDPAAFAVSPDGRLAYVSNGDDRTISVLRVGG